MLDAALCRIGAEHICCYADAADQQEPEEGCCPAGLEQEGDDVRYRVGVHNASSFSKCSIASRMLAGGAEVECRCIMISMRQPAHMSSPVISRAPRSYVRYDQSQSTATAMRFRKPIRK